jgi:hypothetical protein
MIRSLYNYLRSPRKLFRLIVAWWSDDTTRKYCGLSGVGYQAVGRSSEAYESKQPSSHYWNGMWSKRTERSGEQRGPSGAISFQRLRIWEVTTKRSNLGWESARLEPHILCYTPRAEFTERECNVVER